MFKRRVLSCAVLMIPHLAQAQPTIDAGSQIREIPPAPTLNGPPPEIRVERRTVQREDPSAGPTIQVTGLDLVGQTKFSAEQLLAASGFSSAGGYTFHQLRQFAAAIANFYNARGFLLAQAYLPAQDIRGGRVTIAIIEGRYGQIALQNRAGLHEKIGHKLFDGLKSGDTVLAAPLERRLLLLADLPGVVVRSTLSPGSRVGTSDLVVEVASGRRISGSIEADNGGNRFTGAERFGGSVNVNNPTGRGDLISLRVLASTTGLAYGRAAYQTPVGSSTIGAAYSHINYRLGREFRSLDADGTADVASIYGSHPLVRSRRANLYVVAGFDAKWFVDRLGAVSTVTSRRAQLFNVGLNGNNVDNVGGGGSNVYSIGASVGNLQIRSAADRAIDQMTARTDGSFGKVQASFARLQQVTRPVSLYGSVRGQVAASNLDSSEKMQLGGAYAVRAYPEGEAYGDEGYLATAEARLLLPKFAVPGRLQLIGFIDVGAVRYAHNPWFSGPNVAHRSGFGGGVNWTAPNDFLVEANYARKLGRQQATSFDDGRGRFWFRVAKLF